MHAHAGRLHDESSLVFMRKQQQLSSLADHLQQHRMAAWEAGPCWGSVRGLHCDRAMATCLHQCRIGWARLVGGKGRVISIDIAIRPTS